MKIFYTITLNISNTDRFLITLSIRNVVNNPTILNSLSYGKLALAITVIFVRKIFQLSF